MEIAIVLSLLVAAIVLFATEKISVDIVTAILLIVLVTTGIITTREAFEGFSNDVIIILASVFVITAALQNSGILEVIADKFIKLTGVNQNTLLFNILTISSTISAFLNNTTLTALLINPVMGVAKKLNISVSKLLLPLAFAAIIGGNCTLIGTSTNVAVSGYIEKTGLKPLSMFEVFPIGAIITVVFIFYMMTIGKRLLPDKKHVELEENYGIREYLSEIVIMPDSPLTGQLIYQSDLSRLDFTVLGIIRNGIKTIPHASVRIAQGDILLIKGKIDDLLKVKKINGIEIKADIMDFYKLKDSELKLAELLIPSKSSLLRLPIKEINFRQRYGLVVLAIHRAGQTLRDKIGNIEIQVGDLLLVQGSQSRFNYLHSNTDFIVLEEHRPLPNAERKGIMTLALFILAIVLGTLEVLPLAIAFLSAVVLTLLLKVINVEKAYRSIDWQSLILIGGMSAFGTAMAKTGADQFLSRFIVDLFEPLGVRGVLGGFILLTVLLTQSMSNAAAALVVIPIALQTAISMDVNPRTFAIAVMMAASVSVITPFEPACILVYGPGKYKFSDFLKTGTPLTILLMILLLLFIPVFWPLYGNGQ